MELKEAITHSEATHIPTDEHHVFSHIWNLALNLQMYIFHLAYS